MFGNLDKTLDGAVERATQPMTDKLNEMLKSLADIKNLLVEINDNLKNLKKDN